MFPKFSIGKVTLDGSLLVVPAAVILLFTTIIDVVVTVDAVSLEWASNLSASLSLITSNVQVSLPRLFFDEIAPNDRDRLLYLLGYCCGEELLLDK